jgi:hypothetical protein
MKPELTDAHKATYEGHKPGGELRKRKLEEAGLTEPMEIDDAQLDLPAPPVPPMLLDDPVRDSISHTLP